MEEAEKGAFERNAKPRLDDHPGPAAGLFTDDLILEILSRLPARSLHRFKCVSVRWRNLIADPANRKMLPQTLAGFLYTIYIYRSDRHRFASVSGDGAAPFHPSLPYLQPNKYKDMAQVDACNGLLLYLSSGKHMVKPWAWAELWCLKDCDSKELVLKHTASIDELMSTTGEKYRVVGIHPDCDTIFLVSCGGDTLVAYDMQHEKVGCILNLEKSTQRFLPYVPLFSESLADGDGR